jgi:hypothetical protein
MVQGEEEEQSLLLAHNTVFNLVPAQEGSSTSRHVHINEQGCSRTWVPRAPTTTTARFLIREPQII